MAGDDDGGFDLLSERLLGLFGKTSQHYEKVARDLIITIKAELTKSEYYVLRLPERNFVFFNKVNEFAVFESSPTIAENIAEKKILYSSNFEFKNHLRLLSFKK
jgi:hypothetical protein